MSAEPSSQEPALATLVQDPVKDKAEHAHEQSHAFDSPEEVAHAKHHAVQNIFWFIGFFSIVLCAVANYEFYGTNNIYAILALAAARCLLIAFFMNWLFSGFSLVFRTFLFTIIFLGGMIFLSLWDSEIKPGVVGDPIYNYKDPKSMHP
jgi:hypothetical protein